jgi:N-methylhydantoinase A
VEAAAWGIHRIVNENMANAARVHIIEKGLDPRFFSMMAFGGAGPVHAFHVAQLMHAPQLIVPAGAGVLSALGFLVSPVATEEITSHVCRLDQINWKYINSMIAGMQAKGTEFLKKAGISKKQCTLKLVADMRYLGQGHEITVNMPPGRLSAASLPAIEAAFKAEYRLRYGRDIDNIPVEAVTWRLLASGPLPKLVPKQAVQGEHKKPLKGARKVYWGHSFVNTPVYDRYALSPGKKIKGPCIIEEFESTTVVGPGSVAYLDAHRNIIIDMRYT